MPIAAILSLLGSGLGGLLRFVPEIFKFMNSKADREHEFKMSELQLKVDQARSQQQIDLVHAQGEESESAGNLQAYIQALKGQSQITGVKWIDGLSASVRPIFSYWWLLLFTGHKATVVTAAWQNFGSWKEFGDIVWTTNDWGILSMITSFWFCDRVFRKHDGK